MRKIVLTTLLLVCGALATACVAQSSNNPAPNSAASTQASPNQTAPSQSALPTEISAELGPCAVLFTVNGKDGKPVYNAKITTRVRYGMGSLKRLDLEAATNSSGQAK